MLQRLLEESAHRHPDRVAAEDPGRGEHVTYRQLNDLADNLCGELSRQGVKPSDRVGIYARKSIPALAGMFGVLKAGAAYVPIAAGTPGPRVEAILDDCSASAAFVDGEAGLTLVNRETRAPAAKGAATNDLAYILYTSGSTGEPKGVMHSHASASCFIDWCSATFEPGPADRFSSHAPFCFDLSIFDVYVAIKHGATVVLIREDDGKLPTLLASLIAERRISIWYSTPTVLRLLTQYGRMERYDYTDLRLVLFAGEVFPPRHLDSLRKQWPGRRYYNLYGPTETNVCTFHEVREHPSGQPSGRPSIGTACAGTLTRVVHESGREARPGERGELHVSGGTVMSGYWNRPELDAQAFVTDVENRRWYKTGDLVTETEDGRYLFLGRLDRMVKRRGFRIELGEIESALYRHPRVAEAAVVAIKSPGDDVRIEAFLLWAGERRASLVELKRFCADNMLPHLIPDGFSFVEAVPKTATNKIDYRSLTRMRSST